MDVVLTVLTIILMVCTVVMAFVVYQLMKGLYLFLLPVLEKRGTTTLLFKLSPKLVTALFVCCFLALVI